jgi:hypothetical protein
LGGAVVRAQEIVVGFYVYVGCNSEVVVEQDTLKFALLNGIEICIYVKIDRAG